MALKYQVGDTFPSLSVPNDHGQHVSMAGLTDGQPLILSQRR